MVGVRGLSWVAFSRWCVTKRKGAAMAIRKRGKSYQIDYLEPNGKRIRKTFKKRMDAEAEAAFLRSGGFPGHWTGSRIELNAMTSPQFVAFIEQKLQGLGVKKVVPSAEILSAAWKRAHRIAFLEKALQEAKERFNGNHLPIPEDLSEQVTEKIKDTGMSWDHAIWEMVT
jgi:hypothetical protein